MSKPYITIDECLKRIKSKILFYGIGFIIISLISFFFITKESQLLSLIFILLSFIYFIDKIIIYRKTKFIKKNCLNMLNTILFWNQNNYFLTDSHFIILIKDKLYVFGYDDIQTIQKEYNYYFGRSFSNDFLYVTLKNKTKIKVPISSSGKDILSNTNFDMSLFLLSKNKKIKELETIVKVLGKSL